ncbi:MAG: response regulator transcription factor [Idiomarina sp.]|nr:response regulator transcription factor [Idiomarina sp.]
MEEIKEVRNFVVIAENYSTFLKLKSILDICFTAPLVSYEKQWHMSIRQNQIVPTIYLIEESACTSSVRSAATYSIETREDMYVLFDVSNPATDFSLALLKGGFNGVLFESDTPEVLMKAMRRLGDGESWFSRRVVERALREYQEGGSRLADAGDQLASIYDLSKRELQITQLLIQGATNTAIAEQLFISQNTVKSHVARVFRKLDVNSRQEILSVVAALHDREEVN